MSVMPLRVQRNGVLVPRFVRTKKTITNRTAKVDAFVVASTIGDGVCGKVKRATLQGHEVALKMLKKETTVLCSVQREVRLQAMCHDHRNIVTCFDFMESQDKFFVAMELGQCDLFDFIQRAQPQEEEVVKAVTRQLLSAVAHMHAKGVCHRDIKPENIVVLSDQHVGLTDFGFAMEWSEDDGLQSSSAGTVRCLPPEMFLKDERFGTRQYNPKMLDVWGVGVVLFYMLSGRFPFDCDTPHKTASAIATGTFSHTLPDDVSIEARDLLVVRNERLARPFSLSLTHSRAVFAVGKTQRLMEADPNKRTSASAALHHPFVARLPSNHSS